jgi:hypothetical protein
LVEEIRAVGDEAASGGVKRALSIAGNLCLAANEVIRLRRADAPGLPVMIIPLFEPCANAAIALMDKFAFKAELDEEARHIVFGHRKTKAA